jgi:GT2 family glycosyltransferase
VARVTGSSVGSGTGAAVDVVVPVYNAVEDLERCVESVLAHTDRRYRLVLIDDASPDPAIAAYFDALARRALSHVVLLRNRRNRGFPRTANRGMLLSRSDVVLLNSDTVVTRGWLSALVRCAASSATDWNRDAVLQQRGDLFVSAILREQRAGRRRRSRKESAASSRAPRCRRTRSSPRAWASASTSDAS